MTRGRFFQLLNDSYCNWAEARGADIEMLTNKKLRSEGQSDGKEKGRCKEEVGILETTKTDN